jgi:hypothetical protein
MAGFQVSTYGRFWVSTEVVEFDLYILDSWEGLGGFGPDLFSVSVETSSGVQPLLDRVAFSNSYTATEVQTFAPPGSGSARLQLVPTLTGLHHLEMRKCGTALCRSHTLKSRGQAACMLQFSLSPSSSV